jgi:uncharacterized protein
LYQVIIAGENLKDEFVILNNNYLPGSIRIRLQKASSVPLLADKKILPETSIYVCKDKTCGLPQKQIRNVIMELFP